MPAYLIDTNHASRLMDGAEPILKGRVQAEQKTKGRPIPSTDAQTAAVARLHELTVLTTDRHFGFVSGLTTANWLEA